MTRFAPTALFLVAALVTLPAHVDAAPKKRGGKSQVKGQVPRVAVLPFTSSSPRS